MSSRSEESEEIDLSELSIQELADRTSMEEVRYRQTNEESSTPLADVPRCPRCLSRSPYHRVGSIHSDPSLAEYRCETCELEFADPIYRDEPPVDAGISRLARLIELGRIDPDQLPADVLREVEER
jgi:DNA-directed RNA polymerase subunit RPC12/RpoP